MRVEFAITLRNHKDVPIAVQVNEPVGGTWRMVRSSHEWEKTGAWAAQFTVPSGERGERPEVPRAGDVLIRLD